MALSGSTLRARGVTGPIDLWLISNAAAAFTLTALAASPTITDFSTAARRYLDLRHVLKWQCSGMVGTGAIAGGVVGFQYSVNAGSTWFWMDGTDGSAPPATAAPVISLATNLVISASSVLSVPPAARTAATLVRVAATGGNGSASPATRSFTLSAVELVL